MKNTLLLWLAFIIAAPALGQIKDDIGVVTDSTLRELPDQRTYNSKTYYNSKDETFTTVVSAGYIHYQKPDRSYHDIDTRFQTEDSAKAFAMNAGLYRVRVDHHANAGRDFDVILETPRPVREKFRDPGKGPSPTAKLRWKLSSFGYLDLQQFLYRPLEFPNPVEQKVNDNRLEYPEIFYGIDLRYTCKATGFKEEFILSEKSRERLPSPEQIGFVPEQTYLMFAFEFNLTPNNLQVFARTHSGREPIKTNGRFAFNGQGQVEIEDEDANLRLFLPEDYAWAEADSANENVERARIRRYIYTERGKDYMHVGVPWQWVNAASKGNLIIDPTVSAATSQDTRIQDMSNYGSGTTLTIGKPTGFNKRRTLIEFNILGAGIPPSATMLNAQMKLWYYGNNGTPAIDRWVQAHQLLLDWDEMQANSIDRLAGGEWNVAFVGLNDIDAKASYESTLLFSQNEPTSQWKSWDLTALTQKWREETVQNYGVVLWATNDNTDGQAMQFNSSEAASNQPKLEIIWSNTPKTVYFLKDHLGSIRATVLDSATAPVIGYDDYDPWGYPLAVRTKPIPTVYLQGASKNKFTGQEWDDDFGVNWSYFPARSYDSQSARWLSVDPLERARPWESPYLYVGGNPVVRIDPDGLYWVDTNRDGIADTWVVEDPIYAKPESQDDEAMIRPRYGRLFGLGFLAVGEAAGHNDFFRAWTGTDPFSQQQISNAERAISTGAAILAVVPIGFARGTAKLALVENRLHHAARHLIEKGLLSNWNNTTKQKFIELATFVLENPTQTYDKVIRGGTPVKAFVGEVEGKVVEIWISKGGQVPAGEIVSAIVR